MTAAAGEATRPAGGNAGPELAEGRIREQLVVAILRLDDRGLSATQATAEVIRICEVLGGAGIGVAEVTTNRGYAIESIAGVAERFGGGLLLGAGTVLDVATVDAVADAGARFCVSPHLDAEVVAACRRRGLLPIPGVLSPTEVASASALGLGLLKLFPAEPLGISYLKALRAPFGGVGFMPTGGIGVDNAADWLAAGAAALGIGSSLVPGNGSLDGLGERASLLAKIVAEWRQTDGEDR